MSSAQVQPFRSLPRTIEEYFEMVRAPPGDSAPSVVFQTDPTDIFIATFPKSGTTWTQQIVHALRSRGAMDFEEISEVVPFIDVAGVTGIDLNAPQVAKPRAFKTHLRWDGVPKGGRYIHVLRNPYDVFVSYYHFFNGICFERDSIPLETYIRAIFLGDKPTIYEDYWTHLLSYWERRHSADTLTLFYEDMLHDHEGAVRQVAHFMGVAADEGLILLATKQSGFDFMHAHKSKFNDAPTIGPFLRFWGFPQNQTTKVRTGRGGDGAKYLSQKLQQELDRVWETRIAGPLGLRSYEELRTSLAEERKR